MHLLNVRRLWVLVSLEEKSFESCIVLFLIVLDFEARNTFRRDPVLTVARYTTCSRTRGLKI
jgi:hypothetical protein